MTLVFCTSNAHKLSEVNQICGSQLNLLSLRDIGYAEEIPEPFETLEENSATKARQVYDATGRTCVAEDTGLFIEALNGQPGVYSARYAGEPSNSERNILKVMNELQGIENRRAYFKTVVSFIVKGELHQFSGVCQGTIATEATGAEGFGYDPIFIPEGDHRSFAVLSAHEKNEISHRRKAFQSLLDYLALHPVDS